LRILRGTNLLFYHTKLGLFLRIFGHE
jgi:hypothetical protein